MRRSSCHLVICHPHREITTPYHTFASYHMQQIRVRQNATTMRWCIVNDNGIMDAVVWREVRFMELPESYIPIDRRLAIARGADLPVRTSGAALFADISGFTPLTETLTRELGPQ